MIELNIDVELKKFQKDIINKGLDYNKKNLCIVASRQIGKSFSLRILSLCYLTEDKSFVGYITLTNKLGKLFYSSIYDIIPKYLIKKANTIDLTIELINGSKMQFFSIESVENIRGFTLTHLIIDECAFAREETPNGQNIYNNILLPLLDAKGKKCILCSTPWGKRGLFWEAYTKSMDGNSNWDSILATIYDDESKTKEWIEERKNNISSLAWKQEYLCEFLDDGASFFKNYKDWFLNIEDFTPKKCWAGIDFSTVGEDNTILTLIFDNNVVKQFLIEGTLDEKYNKIATILNSYSKILQSGYAENNSIGKVMFNEIQKRLDISIRNKILEYNTSQKTKPDMINYLATTVERGELIFDETDTNLLYEFSVFSYTINPNTKNVSYAALPGEHDDRIMSLALANICRRDKKRTGLSIFTY